MTNLIHTWFILQYVYYNPLHVSSITCSSSGGWIVLMQHLISSLSVSGRPVHRLRENWLDWGGFSNPRNSTSWIMLVSMSKASTPALELTELLGIGVKTAERGVELHLSSPMYFPGVRRDNFTYTVCACNLTFFRNVGTEYTLGSKNPQDGHNYK